MVVQVLACGSLPPHRVGEPLRTTRWTLVGAAAIPLWATWPALATWGSSLPPFELLAIAFAVAWLLLTGLERASTAARGAATVRWRPVLACALGLSGSNALFILATAHMPAAEANLLAYLWPIMVAVGGAVLGLFRLQVRHLAGLALGLVGAAIVLGGATARPAGAGIGLALLSGAAWAAYCLFRLREGAAAGNVLAAGCGASAAFCAGLHVALEQTVAPTPGALLAALGVGIAPLALANLAWDQGLRRGDGRLLAVMAYATPLVSGLILVAAGVAAATPNLVVGALVIVAAGLLAGSGGRRG